MAYASLQEELTDYRRLLRRACATWGGTMPNSVAAWWAAEQALIAQEAADAAARKAEKIATLEEKIAMLQAELAALRA